MYEATVETPRHATESVEKVRRAVLNLFPETRLEEGEDLTGRSISTDGPVLVFCGNVVAGAPAEPT